MVGIGLAKRLMSSAEEEEVVVVVVVKVVALVVDWGGFRTPLGGW